MQKNNLQKFLIIRISSLGDVLLTSALVRCIKKTFPDATIDFVVDKQFADIVKYNPHINNVIVYDKKQTIKENNSIKKNLANDYKIIDLQNNFRSIFFRKGLGNEIAIFKKKYIQKLFLVWLKINLFDKNLSIPEKYINTANKFGIKSNINNANDGLEIWLPEEKELEYYPPTVKFENCRSTIKTANNSSEKKYIFAIAPSAKHKTKQWLPEYFSELILLLDAKYNAKFYLLGGQEDKEICSFITAKINSEIAHSREFSDKIENSKKIEIFDYSGKTSIIETVRLVDECDLLVTNDTGIMHIGAARKLPLVVIFGSTVTNFGFAPYRTKYEICEVDLPCRPCTHIGQKECPKKHFNCMKLITPEMVLSKIQANARLLLAQTLFVF